MLILECSQGCYGRTDGWKKDGRMEGRTDGSVTNTISLRNFVGEGIIKGNAKYSIITMIRLQYVDKGKLSV
jgi:hypothetical protein